MKYFFGMLAILFLGACGVKGKNQPPLYAPPMGRGKPTLNSTQQGLKLSPLLSPNQPAGEPSE